MANWVWCRLWSGLLFLVSDPHQLALFMYPFLPAFLLLVALFLFHSLPLWKLEQRPRKREKEGLNGYSNKREQEGIISSTGEHWSFKRRDSLCYVLLLYICINYPVRLFMYLGRNYFSTDWMRSSLTASLPADGVREGSQRQAARNKLHTHFASKCCIKISLFVV